jgi:hypothetical protein
MTDSASVREVVRQTLTKFALRDSYPDEQRDLQKHIKDELDAALSMEFPTASLVTTRSIGGREKPRLKLLGTSFWPDLDVKEGNTRHVAIEVKIVREGARGASKAIAETIGQSVIYATQYPFIFAFVVHRGRTDKRLHDLDDALTAQLSNHSIELILRQ